MFRHLITPLLAAVYVVAVASTVAAQCTRLPDGSWSCPRAAPTTQPTAMDVRIECPAARGSGTAVARLASGGTLVVTNHHVVRDQPRIVVHSGHGQTATGRLAAIDAANDLAAVAIEATWPIVSLGDDVAIGTPVQFRAFDAGVRFRKYFGHIASEYSEPCGAGGWFATGQSVPGNSGGGVYRHGRLVGVVWGNPNGGTALVRIGPVQRLINRVVHRETVTDPARNPLPSNRPSDAPVPGQEPPVRCFPAGDCEERLQAIEQQLTELSPRQPVTPPPAMPLDWLQLAAAALGISGPIGAAIVAVGWLLGSQRERGAGGPRDEDFRRRTASRFVPDHETSE